jgi:hypothetical protein
VERILRVLGYDEDDCNADQQRYLAKLRASSVPIPLARLARLLGTTPKTLEEHVEPWLFAKGLVGMTSGGRVPGPYARGDGVQIVDGYVGDTRFRGGVVVSVARRAPNVRRRSSMAPLTG